MTQQITVNRQNQNIGQLDMAKKHVKNASLISEYKPIASDLMGLSWIFADGDDDEGGWNPHDRIC